jgi:GNAT superfamily N-acetyltransferase
MNIRPATTKDADAISKLIASLASFFTTDPEGKGAERFMLGITAEAVRDYIRNPGFHYIVALHEDRLAGAAALRDGRHLFHLFVAPDFQRRGIARKLWLALRKQAAPGIDGFTVNSTPYAVPVYERFGFSATGPKVEMNGIAFVPMKTAVRP